MESIEREGLEDEYECTRARVTCVADLTEALPGLVGPRVREVALESTRYERTEGPEYNSASHRHDGLAMTGTRGKAKEQGQSRRLCTSQRGNIEQAGRVASLLELDIVGR